MAAPDFGPPEEFEEYRIIRALGQGTMGRVYLARDVLLDRLVALKFLPAVSAGRRDRFITEARAIARLAHPNVLGIYRVGEVKGVPYLVSPFVEGHSLDRVDKPMPGARVLAIGLDMARGLAAAHRRGVLHRDIKPANAIVSGQGDVKLLDFGLAKLVDAGVDGASEEDAGVPSTGFVPAEIVPARPASPRSAAAAADATLSLGPGEAPPPSIGVDPPAALHVEAARTQIVGTPAYMAPEVWRGEPAGKPSDVYSLGVVLYELATGRPPFIGTGPSLDVLRHAVLFDPVPALVSAAPGIDARLAETIERCLARDPALRPESGEALRDALEMIAAPARDTRLPAGNPYRGLLAFDADHRTVFFGRGQDTRAVVDRLRSEAFVIVVGDSGVGKSSLCRAGVLPAVEQGGLGDDRRWTAFTVAPGRHPVTALAAALAAPLGLDETALAGRIRADPLTLARELRRRSGRDGTVLFVDQLEEIWTFAARDEADVAAAAIAGLAVHAPAVRLLATVRSDFLTRLATLPGIEDQVASGLHLLRPLGAESARDVIEGPARIRGFRFESPAMVDGLAASLDGVGALPLLQFSLAELWERRDEARRIIPESALGEIGGVEGALARHADGVVAGMEPAERAAAWRILTRLVTAQGTRLRLIEAEICRAGDEHARAALRALVRGRLLVERGATEGNEGTFEIAHEALTTGWGALRDWLGSDGRRRGVLDRLRTASTEWERLGRPREWLWNETQMAGLGDGDIDMAPRDRAFLDASRRAARRRRIGRMAAALAAPAIVALAITAARVRSRVELHRLVGASMAQAEELLDQAGASDGRVARLRSRAFAQFDQDKQEAAETTWSEALAAAQAEQETLRSASQQIEGALALDPDRSDVRARLADVLLLRVLASEREGLASEAVELAARIASYDDGSRRHRMSAPASVEIVTDPAGVDVTIETMSKRAGRSLYSTPRPIGRSPLAIALPPGSYRLGLAARGRAPVKAPVRVERAEALRVAVEVPRSADLPEGFVLVPAGRALLGTADGEDVRRGFLGAAPIHPVETGPYLIGRAEVTFADWIAFLEDLPAQERARRTPQARGPHAALDLVRAADGRWELTLRRGGATTSARVGENIRYPARTRRGEQDWRRFPVSGISFEDALAYAAWLDRTGRVPGARLCDEREWERAARGADGRRFPGGDRLGPDDANHDVTYGRNALAFGPDEVGSHPAGRSPFDLDDMAGNVWEMTRARGTPGVALRGGSFYQGDLTCRADNREPGERLGRDALIGTRICADFRTHHRTAAESFRR